MRILVVEDEPELAFMLETLLESAGHDVIGTADTANAALDILENKPVEIALVDINLRNGSLGTDLARELASKNVQCIFTTSDVDAANANADVAIGLIAKPYRTGTVVTALYAAECVMMGVKPSRIPQGLELFNTVTPAQ